MAQASHCLRPLMICVGTRPEIIKIAPVCAALRSRGVPFRLLHTGQHAELAEPIYHALDLEPDARLALARDGQTLAELSAALLQKIDPVLEAWRPSALLVHGDTTSATMAALAGFYRDVPVGHVEAGLRSHVARDPFPEELNRSLIGRIARWNFAPTPAAVNNLREEGIPAASVHLVGNTIVEATQQATERLRRRTTRHDPSLYDGAAALAQAGVPEASKPEQRVILVTAHRRENWGAPIAGLVRALAEILVAHQDLAVIWLLHANPVLASQVHAAHAQLPAREAARLHLRPALGYLEMIEHMNRAWLVLTDSGGLQEEACALGVPILVFRETTERPEIIEAGAGRLVGTNPRRIVAEIDALLGDSSKHRSMRVAGNPFGDGLASSRIASVLADWLARADRQAQPTAANRSEGSPLPPRTRPPQLVWQASVQPGAL